VEDHPAGDPGQRLCLCSLYASPMFALCSSYQKKLQGILLDK
jgi:hypothetical protein